jgi:hypothetical protein
LNSATKKTNRTARLPRAACETFNAEPATDKEILAAIRALSCRLSRYESGATIRYAVQDVTDRLNGKDF